MWRFMLVAAFGCVSADLKHAIEMAKLSNKPAPKYVQSLETLKKSSEILVNLLPDQDLPVTDPRRHYVIIIGVFACIVEYLNSDCTPPDYEREYLPAVDRLLPVVWEQPVAVVEKMKNFLDDISNTVDVVTQLKGFNCKSLSDDICNRILDVYFSQSDEYDDVTEILFEVGELIELFKKEAFDLEAQKYNEVPLLIHGKAKFKQLILKAANVYHMLYGKFCQP